LRFGVVFGFGGLYFARGAMTLGWPITPYEVTGYAFGQRVRSRIILWARHLGDDILAEPGTPVVAIGAGKVVWAEMRPGSEARRNWGGIVIIEHIHKTTGQTFYSLYGHVQDLLVKVGDEVPAGQKLAVIADGSTPENGWWKLPHLHFAIYCGPWTDTVLPGYKRFFDGRTKFGWWRNPKAFIEEYSASL
jgi:murein DD-endopeptidase MepM/ murein hydrolase activator NlpD